MIYNGNAFTISHLKDGIAELTFNLKTSSVNKFCAEAIADLDLAIKSINENEQIKGIILTSAKEAFVVGADITEFTAMFAQSEEVILEQIVKINHIFSAFEDLRVPTIAAINGLALGGGFEICLCADYRVCASTAQVGLPEVKLGLYPGWGGTVRLSRLIGADNAIDWICTGKQNKAEAALAIGAVDAVVAPEKLKDSATSLLKQCIEGKLEFKQRRENKKGKLNLPPMESMMVFETAKPFVAAKAGPHYPAPLEAIKTIQKHATMTRDKAIYVEARGFVKLAKTSVAQALVGLFMNDQALKKSAKKLAPLAHNVKKAAVLGAGIMGGGIAYQSACKGLQILMKDINQEGLDIGLNEANKLLNKQIERKKIDTQEMGNTLNRIIPTLSYGDFNTVDIVVEAVVEKLAVKQAVLTEVEAQVNEKTVLTSNTSTILITDIAQKLAAPERFCGMHFFNPVHRMPLVEVIRGKKTNETTIATVVQYAKSMGKTPIVVNDCPGFLVNRVLFPYFAGFAGLVKDGADFHQIDKVMERFGWPMGPAYLLDVVGMDTAHHAEVIMAQGYPDRMKKTFRSAVDVMFDHQRFGQKIGKGFYQYVKNKKGKVVKKEDESTLSLLTEVSNSTRTFDKEEIIQRMMIPLCLETVRALEEGIVSSPAEADMGLILGIGFPPFIGGALKYLDQIGLANFIKITDKYTDLGALYHPTEKLREMAKNNLRFYQS